MGHDRLLIGGCVAAAQAFPDRAGAREGALGAVRPGAWCVTSIQFPDWWLCGWDSWTPAALVGVPLWCYRRACIMTSFGQLAADDALSRIGRLQTPAA